MNTIKKKQIIFISQGITGKELSKKAVELSDNNNGYKIIYKLHPGEFAEWDKEYPWLATAYKKE